MIKDKYASAVLLSTRQSVYLETVFNFCYTDYRSSNYKTCDEFTNEVIDSAFEDPEYKASLLQFFNSEDCVKAVLAFVTCVIWENSNLKE